MYREDGKLAATGRHVKYLPMGRAWDITATPLFFPVATKWMTRQHKRWLTDPERTKARRESARHKGGARKEGRMSPLTQSLLQKRSYYISKYNSFTLKACVHHF